MALLLTGMSAQQILWKSGNQIHPCRCVVAIQTEDLKFKAEGAIGRPIESNAFSLKYELTGTEYRRA